MSGGGNARIASHNQGFSLIETFNNLALWEENKFVSEQERTYKFKRGVNNILDCHAIARNDVNCHTEDNSPKYRMVGKIYQCLTNVDKRLRNKCAMIGFGKKVLSLGRESKRSSETSYACERGLSHELINCEPSPEFLTDKFYSLFTTHRSLINNDKDFSLKRPAFTLAEVLVTLGIIGVVAALTIPTLVANYRENVLMAQFKKSYATVANGFRMAEIENGAMKDWPMGSQMDIQDFWTTYIKPYFNSAQICMDDNDCGYHYLNISEWSGMSWNLTTDETRLFFKLVDGTVIFMPRNTTNANGDPSYVDYFYIDVNGPKKPNKLCYDVFTFTRGTDKGISPRGCATEIIGNNWKIPSDYSYGK